MPLFLRRYFQRGNDRIRPVADDAVKGMQCPLCTQEETTRFRISSKLRPIYPQICLGILAGKVIEGYRYS